MISMPLDIKRMLTTTDYLMGHLTLDDVESSISENASGWGTQRLGVRMGWGSRIPLSVDVVTLVLRDSNSEFGYQNQAVGPRGSPRLVRKVSPALGIAPGAMAGLEGEYAHYVREVVKRDLDQYVWTAYDDQHSDLAERLLESVCEYYQAGLVAGDEVGIVCLKTNAKLTPNRTR